MSDEWDYEKRGFRIYLISNLINGKGYVGITMKALEERLAEHIYTAKNNPRYTSNGRMYPLQAAIIKYGADNFGIEELDYGLGLTDAKEKETYFIKILETYAGHKTGYNFSFGGETPDRPQGT